MPGRRIWIGRGHWNSMLLCAYMALSLGSFTSAALLSRRQTSDFSAEHPNDSDDSSISSSIAVTAPAPTAAIDPTTNATAVSNGTAKASTVSSAAAVATTAFSPLNSTNDPHMCHVKYTTDSEGAPHIANPFCKPYQGQEVYPDIQYQVTWDPTPFTDGANNTVQVYHAENTGLNSPATAQLLASLNSTNFPGSVFLNMSSAWLKGQPTANLTLNLIVEEDGKDPESFTGPIFTLLSTSSSSDSSHAAPSSGPSADKKLGEKVGLPVGLVFLIVAAVAVALFICLRKRRGGKGYGAGKSLRQRVAGGGSSRGHRRDPSFHDEPTTAVELKDRNRGLTGESPEDSWDWGSPVGSPTSVGGGGNAFRDEIQRQRSGR